MMAVVSLGRCALETLGEGSEQGVLMIGCALGNIAIGFRRIPPIDGSVSV
jgi:hypothetical protein